MSFRNWHLGFFRYGNCWTFLPSVSRYSNSTFYTWWRFYLRVTFALLVMLPAVATAGHCKAFFHHKQVAVVAPVYQPVYYSVGDNVRLEALAEKVAAIVTQKLQAAPTLQQTAAPQPILAAKCARCHSGESAKGGHVIDGSAAIDCDTFRRTMEMLSGNGAPPPAGMQAVLAGLKDEDKAAIMDSMLKLPSGGLE